MKLRIYDYENCPVDIELPDKPIHSIIVLILSGMRPDRLSSRTAKRSALTLMPRIRRADEGLIIATVIIRSMEI